ncbi:MAG: VanZ family protein [Anaerocolumna sp.]
MLNSELKILVERILNDIMEILTYYVPFAMISSIIILIIYYFFKRNRKSLSVINFLRFFWKKVMLQYLFCVYSILVVIITYLSRETGSRGGMDLQLFSTISWSLKKNIYALENIMLFIPLGIFLPLLSVKLRFLHRCVLLGLLLSLAIEFVQLFTQRGFWQIDDVLMNGVGTFVGYCISVIITKSILQIKLQVYRQTNKSRIMKP